MATDTTDGELGYVLDLLQPRCDERVQNCVALDPCTTAAYSPYTESFASTVWNLICVTLIEGSVTVM
jgi:hypothetical protein